MVAYPFEFIRRALLPGIRPPGVDQTASMDLPEEGVTSITGTGGGVVDLSFSISHSWSRQLSKEEKRKYDKIRTYATSGESVNKNSYVDWEVLREITFENGHKHKYTEVKESENTKVIAKDKSRVAEQ